MCSHDDLPHVLPNNPMSGEEEAGLHATEHWPPQCQCNPQPSPPVIKLWLPVLSWLILCYLKDHTTTLFLPQVPLHSVTHVFCKTCLIASKLNTQANKTQHCENTIHIYCMSNLNSAIETQQSFVKISLWWQNDPHLHHTNTLSDQQPHTSLLYMTYGWWSSTGPEQPNGN